MFVLPFILIFSFNIDNILIFLFFFFLKNPRLAEEKLQITDNSVNSVPFSLVCILVCL